MKLKLRVMMFLLAAIPVATIQADVVDFTDGVFTTLLDSGINSEPVIFSESITGATLTFESTLNLVGIERFTGTRPGIASTGLRLGGGGGSTIEFTVTPSADVIFESYSTTSGVGLFLNPAMFDLTGPGVNSLGNSLEFGNPANLLNGSPDGLLLTGGETYIATIQAGGAASQAFIGSFEVTAVSVPEPASAVLIPMVAATIAVRRRRR